MQRRTTLLLVTGFPSVKAPTRTNQETEELQQQTRNVPASLTEIPRMTAAGLRRLVLYGALNKYPVGSTGLSRIVMAAFAREYSIRVFRDLVIHRLKLSPLSESLNGFLEA